MANRDKRSNVTSKVSDIHLLFTTFLWIYLPFVFLILWASFVPPLPNWVVWTSNIFLVHNLAASLLYLYGTVMTYEETETFKPDWLDWLG